MNITDKVAIVTGASKGIGRSTALALAKAGADVAVSARSSELLESLAQEVKEAGREIFTFTGDMKVEEDIQRFVKETASRFGRLDILINNAGVGHFYAISHMPTARWDEMFNLNIRGMFIATRESLSHLRKAGESVVVNVSSLAGKNAFVGGGGYAATKHAVMGFSRCLMLEERKNGVRVLAICPGSVATHFSDHVVEQKQLRSPKDPDRAMKPEDIASAIIHMIQMPQQTMISEIDMRPTVPK